VIHSPKTVDIALSRGQLTLCEAHAEWKVAEARTKGHRPNHYDEKAFSAYDANLTSALGEMAVSIFTRLPDRFMEEYDGNKKADVGLIEVRTRTIGKEPLLRIYETDPHPITCLAVVQEVNSTGALVRLHGWCFTQIGWSYGKRKGVHWKKGVEYSLTESFLRPMATLVSEHKKAEEFYEFQSR